jgi:hypothetical protein
VVAVAGSLPGRSLATLPAPTPALRTDGKLYPGKGNPGKGCGNNLKREVSYPLRGVLTPRRGLREASCWWAHSAPGRLPGPSWLKVPGRGPCCIKSKKHRDFTRPDKEKVRMQAREAYQGGSRRQPHSRSFQPATLGDGPPTGAAWEVLAHADELTLGAEARGLAKCESVRRRRGR